MSIKRYAYKGSLYDKNEHTSAATRKVWEARGCKIKRGAEGILMQRKLKNDGTKLFTAEEVEPALAMA